MSATLLHGNALALPLAAGSVDLIVTSPPYFSMRSYTDGGEHYAGQIGSEENPHDFLDALVAATEEMVRVLKPSGSIWVNLGDKYCSPGGHTDRGASSRLQGRRAQRQQARADRTTTGHGVKPKSLFGLPWRYAIRCIDELGLILRAEVIWAKPNGLPESVTDRVRRSHEQWFHFTVQPRYFSAVDEIREQHLRNWTAGSNGGRQGFDRGDHLNTGLAGSAPHPLGKLPGSVWEVATQPLTAPAQLGVDHFAAFPMEWPRRIIRGWSPSGICTACGQGRRPVAAAVALDLSRPQAARAQQLADAAGLTEEHYRALLSVGVSDTGRGAATQSGTGKNSAEVYRLAGEARAVLGGYAREYLLRRPTSFRDACACAEPTAKTTPAIVVDPFGGTGTTALVADALGRHGVSIDMSADYCRLARWRTTDPGERARAMQVEKPHALPDGMDSLLDLLTDEAS